jgi:hypothetical protein
VSIRVKSIEPWNYGMKNYRYGSAVESGTFFIQDTTYDNYAAISTNNAAYLLIKDIVANSDSFKLRKERGTDAGEVLVDYEAPFIALQPGQKVRLSNYASSGTDTVGVITSGTTARTALSVNANGKVCEKQSTGEGSTALFTMIENDIADDGTIYIQIDAIS